MSLWLEVRRAAPPLNTQQELQQLFFMIQEISPDPGKN